ncbi:MAG TPA: hypothetical protein DCE23_00365 [Firmicutes bacterium]|nr:hypothetical protein [Bacillota bacterium]
MKIRYGYESKKELRQSLNKAMGFAFQKWKIKKNIVKNPKSFMQMCIANYFICLVDFFVVYALYNFGLDNLGTLIALILFGTFFLNTFQLLQYIYSLIKLKDIAGEIRFSEEGIVDTSESGKVVCKPWKKVEMVYVEEDVICIFVKSTFYFFPYSNTNKEVVENAFQKYKPSAPIKEQEDREKNKFKKFFWNVGIYILIFIATFSFSIGFDIYNENILNEETEKMILSREVDFHIYSYQKYGIVEKYVKEYYAEYYQLEQEYFDYSASGTLQQLTPDMFHENRKSLDVFIKNLGIREQKVNATLDKMIAMYNQDSALKRIQKEELGEYYESLYLNLLFTDQDAMYIQELEEEKEINSEKMKYLKKLIQFLLVHSEDWTIADGELYFYQSEYADEYNELYDVIMEEQEKNDGIFM